MEGVNFYSHEQIKRKAPELDEWMKCSRKPIEKMWLRNQEEDVIRSPAVYL